MNINFKAFKDFISLELEVPTICLVTGGVSVRRDRCYMATLVSPQRSRCYLMMMSQGVCVDGGRMGYD